MRVEFTDVRTSKVLWSNGAFAFGEESGRDGDRGGV
jgi:hypothetical protein